ncbi:hypothetical protein B296_00003609 [Ensete ventricosum]|uniref:Uncharacterized protein n=1 Tax=Ensete ventricosum TaxID=4639 RepID=A0A427BCQ4_ENSVE|nr:hypothetical protein B296_00003609 [Ensete ventricosum]
MGALLESSLISDEPVKVAPACPFFWMSPRVVPGACHLGTSYDLPASLPPKFLWLYTSSPVATSLVPEATVGLGQELAMKLSSNSLAKWSKDEMEDDFNWLYHIRVGPLRVVGKNLGNKWGSAFCGLSDLLLGSDEVSLDLVKPLVDLVKLFPHRVRVCPAGCKVDGRTWVNPPGCSEFGLLVGRSCDIGPPSSTKNVVEPSGVELRYRPDLFSVEYASSPMSVGIWIFNLGWSLLGSQRPCVGRVIFWLVSGLVILHTGIFGNGRLSPMLKLVENEELSSFLSEEETRVKERVRELVCPPHLLPKWAFYTCGRGACSYAWPYPCRPSGTTELYGGRADAAV